MICEGDFIITLNHNLDTFSTKKSTKIQLAQYECSALTEVALIYICREQRPLEKDYTYYSAPHSVYTPTDYFFMNIVYRFRAEERTIGVADLLDYSALYLTLNLNSRKKNTTW